MYIGLTEEQERLRQEVRDYYEQLLTPEVRAKLTGAGGVGDEQRKVVRQMGEDGWLGVGWPDGVGRSRLHARSSSSSGSTSRCAPARPCRCSRSTPSARRS